MTLTTSTPPQGTAFVYTTATDHAAPAVVVRDPVATADCATTDVPIKEPVTAPHSAPVQALGDFCTKCGARSAPGAAFCSGCGNAAEKQPSSV